MLNETLLSIYARIQVIVIHTKYFFIISLHFSRVKKKERIIVIMCENKETIKNYLLK